MTFKQIPGYPNYEISEGGEVRNINKQRALTPQPNGKYRTYSLWTNGVQTILFVHYLVMLTFVGERPEGQWVRHLDGDPTNNCLSNLAYGTQKENAADRAKHGTWGQKLTERAVRVMRGLYKCGFTYARLSEIFSVNPSTIFRIVRRRTWKHVV